MSSRMPTTDAGLLAWSATSALASPATRQSTRLTAQAATAYEAVQSTYATAYQTAVDPGTRTRPSIAAKDAAKAALQLASRQLGRIVEGTAGRRSILVLRCRIGYRCSFFRDRTTAISGWRETSIHVKIRPTAIPLHGIVR
ncbi:MAG: hypothetical protein R3C49_27810 [Planctomycetaceae bacterium]